MTYELAGNLQDCTTGLPPFKWAVDPLMGGLARSPCWGEHLDARTEL